MGRIGRLLASILVLGGSAAGLAAPEVHADEPAQLLAQATERLQNDDAKGAISLLRKADALAGGRCLDCLAALSTAYYRTRRYDDVVATARREIALQPPKDALANAYNQLALGYLGDGRASPERIREAEAAYRSAVGLSSGLTPLLRYNLARLLLRTHRPEQAKLLLKAVLDESPQAAIASQARLILEDPACVEEDCAPDYTLALSEGSLGRDGLRGKVVALYFFGRDCSRCELSHSILSRLARRMEKDPFLVVAVSEGRSEPLESLGRRVGIAVHLDQGSHLGRALGVHDRPSRVLIDHRARVLSRRRVLSPREERAQYADHRGAMAPGAANNAPQDDARTMIEVDGAIRRARKAAASASEP